MDPTSAANHRKPLPVWLLIAAAALSAVGLVWFEQRWQVVSIIRP